MKRLMTGFAFVLCAALTCGAVADCIWTGANGFNWNDSGNWEGGQIPNGADAVASFNVDGAVCVTVNVDIVIGRLAVAPATAGGKLTLVSNEKTMTFSSSGVPEINVEYGAELRIESVTLAGSQKVRKSGDGVFAVKAATAQALGLDHAAGKLRLVSLKRYPVTVSPTDGLWTYFRRTSTGVESSDHTPYSGTDGIYFGTTSGSCESKTARTSPIPISGKMRISGAVSMQGSGSWGLVLVLHNDPRGVGAIAEWKGQISLAYSGTEKIEKSFALGLVNFKDNIGNYKWGKNGVWESLKTTDPLIYFNTRDVSGSPDNILRQMQLTLEFDQDNKTANLTLVQNQEGVDVTYTDTYTNVDLSEICGSDQAYLAFLTDAGGRSTYGTIEHLKVEYLDEVEDGAYFSSVNVNSAAASIALEGADDAQLASTVTVGNAAKIDLANGCVNLGSFTLNGSARFSSGVTTVSPSDGEWSHIDISSTGVTNTSHTAYSDSNGIAFGINSGYYVTKTVRRTPIPISGKVTITGDVTCQGSGSWGWAVVLHNDPRGADAMAAHKATANCAYGSDGCIEKSFALGIVNYHKNIGQYRWGKNGVWDAYKTTDPLIYFNTYDGSVNFVRQMKLKLEFDPDARTATLTLVQNQEGVDVTFTDTYTNVDLRELCDSDRAYLAFTTDAGGRGTYGTIDNLKVVNEPLDGERATITAGSMAVSGTPRMELAGVDLSLSMSRGLPSGLGFDLMDGAMFRTVANSVQSIGKGKMTVDGAIIPIGVYTSENCEWIDGGGRVIIGCAGTMIVVR